MIADISSEDASAPATEAVVFAPVTIGPLVSSAEVLDLLCVKRDALYAGQKAGTYPPPLQGSSPQSRNLYAGKAIRQCLDDKLNGVSRDWRECWQDHQGSCAVEYRTSVGGAAQ